MENYAREIVGDGFFDGIDMLVPVPLNRWKRFRRGYNQSEEVARGVSEITGIPIADILKACRHYIQKTGRRVIFEYALSDGVNAEEYHAKELAGLLRGIQCHVNLIPLNPVSERDMKGVSEEKVQRFLHVLQEHGISATRRREMGDDIEGACGQLRRKTVNASEGE